MQNNIKGKTITFYSYKGGVGRTMSLVNIACLMAKKQKKVLLIDWDLEAPGLHSFFKNSINSKSLGLVDLITDFKEYIKIDLNNNEPEYVNFLSENLDKFIIRDLTIENSELQIDIIKAGKFDNEYINKLNTIDWISLYKDAPAFFRTFAQFLEIQYDYILIDSRTGLADTSGVCTMLMPQVLVLVFALNEQNINGVLDVARQSVEYRFDSNDYRNLNILPLPSRIDEQNTHEYVIWLKKYKQKFEVLFKELYLFDDCQLDNYFNIAKIPYKYSYSYGENIPVLRIDENTNDTSLISFHYAQFLKIIEDTTPIWDILSSEQIEANIKQAIVCFQKGLEYYYAKDFEKACLEFEKTCELDSTNDVAFYNWGTAISKLANLRNDEALYKESFEKYQKATGLNPRDDLAFDNWGNAIKGLAKMKNDEALYKECFEKYQKSTELNPKRNFAFYNWGNAIYELAKLKNDKILYKESFEKYQKSTELNPKFDLSFNNWGVAIMELAELENDERLYKESFEKFQKATELNPKFDTAFDNWGNSIMSLSKLKNDTKLLDLSFEKLNKAFELGGKSYNLACYYALKKDKTKALEILENSLRKNEIEPYFVEEDVDWKEYQEDSDFKALIEKYKKEKTK